MAGFNGSGTYLRSYNWVVDKGALVPITASKVDEEMDGMATALSNTICRDGQSTTTAAIPFAAGVRVSDGTLAAPSISFTGDTNTGFYRNLPDEFNIVCGGALAATIYNGGFLGRDGTTAAPGLAFINDSDTGFHRPLSNHIGVCMGGTQVFCFNTVGLGFGTSVIPAAEWIKVGAGTTAKAQFNLASSTAPTSPNNGDVWFDGSALKIRISGTTRTVTVT